MTTPMITGDERRPGGDRPPEKDSSDAFMTIARDNVVTAEGFGLLPGAIVDQHHVRRRRNNRLLSLVLENPTLVGVGIDESTALEVGPGGVWKVLGRECRRRLRRTPGGDHPEGRPRPRRDGRPAVRPARGGHVPASYRGLGHALGSGPGGLKVLLNGRPAGRGRHRLRRGGPAGWPENDHAKALPRSRRRSRLRSSASGEEVTLPAAASIVGGAPFYSDVRAFNTSYATALDVTARYRCFIPSPCSAVGAPQIQFTLAPAAGARLRQHGGADLPGAQHGGRGRVRLLGRQRPARRDEPALLDGARADGRHVHPGPEELRGPPADRADLDPQRRARTRAFAPTSASSTGRTRRST